MTYQMVCPRHEGRWWRGVGLAVWLVVLGCSDPDATGTVGELGAGTFDYSCVANSDAACSSSGQIDSLSAARDFGRRGTIPGAVAVGALFGLRFDDSEGDDIDAFRVVAASRDDEPVSGQYAITQPGTSAFLALEDSTTVLDFALIEAREAVELRVWQGQDPTSLVTLDVGESVHLSVTPLDENGRLLAGALPLRWEVMDASVAKLAYFGSSNVEAVIKNEVDVVVRAQEVGKTVIRLSSGVLGAEVFVEVRP